MMNVRIQFSKGYEAKYVSHLDLMRTFNRMLMRSGLPVSYTQGFNPHIILTFAQPLSVGVTSDGEYAEFQMEERLLLEVLLEKPVNALSSASVWAEANRYYINGKSISLPLKLFAEADADIIAEELKRRTPSNDGSHFPEMIDRFIAADKHHLNALKEEAYSLAGTYFS